jgi:hypothetical protein
MRMEAKLIQLKRQLVSKVETQRYPILSRQQPG